MTIRKHLPPVTKFSQKSGTAQTKAADGVGHAPPPTKYGTLAGTGVQTKQTGSSHHQPPPTKFPAQSVATLQNKVAGGYKPPRHPPPPPTRYSAIQRMDTLSTRETLEQKIIRILGSRRIKITQEEAAYYASELTSNPENTPIPVKGRNRALKLNMIGVVSSVEWRPPSDASRMRVSAFSGPLNFGEGDMLTDGPRPLTGAIIQQDATIDAAALGDIPERPSLAPIMGGSAAKLSSISNSEWLHLIAHSLGGPDTPANLVAGPHSLNTAMIPFERFVRTAVRKGTAVDYSVTFFAAEKGLVNYVHHVQIIIMLPDGKTGTWTLEVNPEKIDEFIHGSVLGEIEAAVKKFEGK